MTFINGRITYEQIAEGAWLGFYIDSRFPPTLDGHYAQDEFGYLVPCGYSHQMHDAIVQMMSEALN